MPSVLPRLKKPKGLKRLKGWGRKEKLPPLPHLGQEPERVAALVDERLQQLTRQLGDESLAKRVLKLQERYPEGTVPEMVVMEYLDRHRANYQYQFWVLGGRVLKGGQVLDFVIDVGRNVIIVEVQGLYWHTRPGKAKLDAGQRMALMGLYVWGKRVSAVVEVWDTRVATDSRGRREQALDQMMLGKEMGP